MKSFIILAALFLPAVASAQSMVSFDGKHLVISNVKIATGCSIESSKDGRLTMRGCDFTKL